LADTKKIIKRLKKLYEAKREDIESRLSDFEKHRMRKNNDESIFFELAFCLLTPQSKAKACWNAIETLRKDNMLLYGSAYHIKKRLHCVRFHNKKADYVVIARNLFLQNRKISIKKAIDIFHDVHECRDWLVQHIKGLGYKEASHFLRNIGYGENIAILDRHILRNLCRLGIIQEIPKSLTRSQYLQIESKMAGFAKRITIPLPHLDLLLWFTETGEIFK
jgi:N-glycosylase/DNA lyase